MTIQSLNTPERETVAYWSGWYTGQADAKARRAPEVELLTRHDVQTEGYWQGYESALDRRAA